MLDLDLLCKDIRRSRSPIRKVGSRLIVQLFNLLQTPSPETKKLFEGWATDFQSIYGDPHLTLSGNRKLNPELLLSEFGITDRIQRGSDCILPLFFSIQTFFSLLLKLITRQLLNPPTCDPAALITASFTKEYGIVNYCDRDSFLWPLFELENGFLPILKELENALIPYHLDTQPPSPSFRDYLKQIYHALIPKPLRHALGEFYTPDWLARLTWEKAMGLEPQKALPVLRVLDPTCGSGTFLLECMIAKRNAGATLSQLLDSIYGIDINPLAVLTAKTNVLLAVADLIRPGTSITLPICCTDILYPPPELPKFDLILGNPPWINWEYLPDHYRLRSQHLWQNYGLFAPHGKGVRFIKEDISVLITYRVMDKLLIHGGLLAFVLRHGIFKSAQNGAAFRRFCLPDGQPMGVLRVDDFSKLRVFDHATGSAALFFARKGVPTTYPVPYFQWTKYSDVPHGAIRPLDSLEKILTHIRCTPQQALPAQANDPHSLWITAEAGAMHTHRLILGENHYKARTGIFTGGANGVYWLRILGRNGRYLQVENIVQRAKRRIPQLQAELEPDYIFPLVRGSDLSRWQVTYHNYLLCPHSPQSKLYPVPEKQLAQSCPNTHRYLSHFRPELDARQGFAGWEKEIQRQHFHAVLKVGDYTFSPYKVAWRYIASQFICAVLEPIEDPWLGTVLPLPNEKIMYISTHCADEAYYLCAILSSAPVTQCIQSYMSPTSISAHVLRKLKLPDFDCSNPTHLELARLCKAGHKAEHHTPYLDQISSIIADLYLWT